MIVSINIFFNISIFVIKQKFIFISYIEFMVELVDTQGLGPCARTGHAGSSPAELTVYFNIILYPRNKLHGVKPFIFVFKSNENMEADGLCGLNFNYCFYFFLRTLNQGAGS